MLENTKIKQQCGVCDRAIWEYNGVKLKKTPEYNQIDVDLNNGTRMTVGVCSNHTKPKKMELKIMTEKMHQGWLEEVAFGIGNEEWVNQVGTKLQVVGA